MCSTLVLTHSLAHSLTNSLTRLWSHLSSWSTLLHAVCRPCFSRAHVARSLTHSLTNSPTHTHAHTRPEQVPGGLLATRFGGKIVLTLSMLGTVIFTAIAPLVASNNVIWMVLARCACGVCQASLYPAWAVMCSGHLPEGRRNLAAGAFSAGASAGVVVGWLLLPLVQKRLGWQYCFYVPAVIGTAWLLVWIAVAPAGRGTLTSSADAAARVTKAAADSASSDEERTALLSPVAASSTARKQRKSENAAWWCEMFTAPAMWGVYTASLAAGWVFYTLLSFLPQYFKQKCVAPHIRLLPLSPSSRGVYQGCHCTPSHATCSLHAHAHPLGC
jgi:MFS family permease